MKMTPRGDSVSTETYDSAQSRCAPGPLYTSWTYWPKGYPNRITESRFAGFDIDHYHARRKRGELLPFTPFYQFTSDCEATMTWETWSNSTHGNQLCQSYGNIGIADRIALTETELQAMADKYFDSTTPLVQAAAAKIYSSGHDSLTFLAELHKVVAMFKNAWKTYLKLTLKGDLAQSWLEYRYGWRILYFDILEIQKVINTLSEERTRYYQRTGRSFTETVLETFVMKSSSWGYAYCDLATVYEISARGTVVADISPAPFQFNPAITAWELTKFSFIVDWFIGIGDWLASNSFLLFNQAYRAAGGVNIHATRTATSRVVVSNSSWYSASFDYNVTTCKAELTRRNPTSVSNYPQININFDVQKAFDLEALFAKLVMQKSAGSTKLKGLRL